MLSIKGMDYSFIIVLVVTFGLMYLLFVLPQKRRDKKKQEMINSLKVGDNVTTIGGICGKVINIKDDEITVETGTKKSQVELKQWGIRDIEKQIEA